MKTVDQSGLSELLRQGQATAELHFGEEAISGQARLVIMNRGVEHGQQSVLIAGKVFGVPLSSETGSGDYEMWECEIIIRPRRKYLDERKALSRFTLCQALVAAFETGQVSRWEDPYFTSSSLGQPKPALSTFPPRVK